MNWEDVAIDNYKNIDFNRKNNSSGLKCNIDLSKIDVAMFFRFLSESGLFYIDKFDTLKNDINLIRFFEENFNFRDSDGKTKSITRLNSDISKVRANNKLLTQIRTLKEIENKIENYRLEIERKYLKK